MAGGAPKGNRNAAKAKEFEGAIRRAIAQRDDPETLRKIADKVLDMALEGNLYAVGMIADRLDGKPAQAVEMSGSLESKTASELSIEQLRHIAAGGSAGDFAPPVSSRKSH